MGFHLANYGISLDSNRSGGFNEVEHALEKWIGREGSPRYEAEKS